MPDKKDILTPAVRDAIYTFAVSIGTLLTFYGLASKEEVELWLGCLTNVLAVVTAFLHRPGKQ